MYAVQNAQFLLYGIFAAFARYLRLSLRYSMQNCRLAFRCFSLLVKGNLFPLHPHQRKDRLFFNYSPTRPLHTRRTANSFSRYWRKKCCIKGCLFANRTGARVKANKRIQATCTARFVVLERFINAIFYKKIYVNFGGTESFSCVG